MSDTISGLVYRLSCDSSQFTAGFDASTRKLQQFSSEAAGASGKISGAFAKAGQDAKGFFSTFASEGAIAGIGAIQGSIASLLSGVAGNFGVAGLAAAGLTAGFVALVAQAEKANKSLVEIGRTARILGVSVTGAQVIEQVLGGDEGGGRELGFRLQARLGELRQNPNAPIGRSLREIGLNPNLVAAAPLTQALGEIFQALKDYPDQVGRAAHAQDILGRSFDRLAEDINRGRGAITRARQDIDLYGASADSVALAEQNREARRNRELQNPSFARIANTEFTTNFLPNLLSVWNGFLDSVGRPLTMDIVRPINFGQQSADALANLNGNGSNSPLGLSPAKLVDAIQPGREAAQDLLRSWQGIERTMGLSARQAQIYSLEISKAPRDLVAQLRVQDEILEREETRARNFANLARGGSGSLAVNGVSSDSLEAARLTADLQVRQRSSGGDPAVRQAQLLTEANRLADEQISELRDIRRALEDARRLGQRDIWQEIGEGK
jgi:hypothetical protein